VRLFARGARDPGGDGLHEDRRHAGDHRAEACTPRGGPRSSWGLCAGVSDV